MGGASASGRDYRSGSSSVLSNYLLRSKQCLISHSLISHNHHHYNRSHHRPRLILRCQRHQHHHLRNLEESNRKHYRSLLLQVSRMIQDGEQSFRRGETVVNELLSRSRSQKSNASLASSSYWLCLRLGSHMYPSLKISG